LPFGNLGLAATDGTEIYEPRKAQKPPTLIGKNEGDKRTAANRAK
jgi:hypothetical protein